MSAVGWNCSSIKLPKLIEGYWIFLVCMEFVTLRVYAVSFLNEVSGTLKIVWMIGWMNS
jgi:hypothetical protein